MTLFNWLGVAFVLVGFVGAPCGIAWAIEGKDGNGRPNVLRWYSLPLALIFLLAAFVSTVFGLFAMCQS